MPSKCMLNNGKIYVIVIKTYRWQLIFQAHRKKTSKRKRQISGRVVRFVLLVVRLQHITHCAQTHMRPSIVSFCESIEHRLVVPVPVVLYQFLVFGSFIICAAQCAYCGYICENVCRRSLFFTSSELRTSERAAIEDSIKMNRFYYSLFEPFFVWHRFSLFLSSFSRNYIIMCNNNNKFENINCGGQHSPALDGPDGLAASIVFLFSFYLAPSCCEGLVFFWKSFFDFVICFPSFCVVLCCVERALRGYWRQRLLINYHYYWSNETAIINKKSKSLGRLASHKSKLKSKVFNGIGDILEHMFFCFGNQFDGRFAHL